MPENEKTNLVYLKEIKKILNNLPIEMRAKILLTQTFAKFKTKLKNYLFDKKLLKIVHYSIDKKYLRLLVGFSKYLYVQRCFITRA